MQWGGAPGVAPGLFKLIRMGGDMPDKIRVPASGAVVGHSGRCWQELFHEFRLGGEEERSVEQEESAAASLGIAGDFPVVDHQIGGTLDAGFAPEEIGEDSSVSRHDEMVGA